MKSIGKFTSVALVAAFTVSSPAQAGPQGWQTASDIGVYSLMAVSIGLPLVQKDTKGALQAAGSRSKTDRISSRIRVNID